jgi:hypothetical protein
MLIGGIVTVAPDTSGLEHPAQWLFGLLCTTGPLHEATRRRALGAVK